MAVPRARTALAVAAALLLASTAVSETRTHVLLTPEKLAWQEAPPSLPPGAEIAVLEGDPSKEGALYAARLRLPDGYRIPPHTHPVTERVTVLAGTFHLGTGETFDRHEAQPLPALSFFAMPAGMPHFAWAEGETIIQLNSMGPLQIEYVDPADDPRR